MSNQSWFDTVLDLLIDVEKNTDKSNKIKTISEESITKAVEKGDIHRGNNNRPPYINISNDI